MKKYLSMIFVLALAGILSLPCRAADTPAAETGKTAEPKVIVLKIVLPEGQKDAKIKVETSALEAAPSDLKPQAPKAETTDPKKKTTGEKLVELGDIKNDISEITDKIDDTWSDFVNWEGFEAWKIVCLFCGLIFTLVLGRTVRWLIEHYAVKLAGKTKTDIDDLTCEALGRPVSLLIFSIGGFLSVLPMLLSAPKPIFDLCSRGFLAVGTGSIAWGIYRLITVINRVLTKLAEKTDNNLDDLIVDIIRKALKVTVFVISVLFIGQNILGLNITTLLAGAGVMGLAIAFAAQDTIASFFGSIMIILDKPFKVGDMITVDGFKGTVEHVGFRSIKMKTLDGHKVTIPNKNVANATIENISVRPFMKLVMNIGLTYDTPHEKMQRAIEVLHEILDNHEGMDEESPPRIVFSAFNDWSLNIAVTCWYHPGDYAAFMKWLHIIDMEILKRFNAENLDFAFPTNTTYLAFDENRKLEISVDSNSK